MKTYQELKEVLEFRGQDISNFADDMEMCESNWDTQSEYAFATEGETVREEKPEIFLDWCLENWA